MDPEADQTMEWNGEANKALPDIFGYHVILNRILEQLPNCELLELSLVSKLWKKEARSVMKKRGNVMAILDSNDFAGCGEAFEAFAKNLETLNEALYSGMTIEFSSIWDCQGTGALDLGAIHESILTGMKGKLKRLTIRLDYRRVCWFKPQNCPFFFLLRLLLRDFIGDLEYLDLTNMKIMEPFIYMYLPLGPYPKLKVLKLNDGYASDEETFGGQIRMLLSRAPNLKEIHTHGWVSFRENLMEGREGVVHLYEPHVEDPIQIISDIAIPALRLKSCYFLNSEEQNLERFNEKAQSLLRTCCSTTLECLYLGDAAAVLLMSYGIQLINLKELVMELAYVELEQFEPRIISILSCFDFTYLFPNLKKVEIRDRLDFQTMLYEFPRDKVEAIIEQANAVRTEPTVPRAGNMKYLVLYQSSFPGSALQFFAHMFPAIEVLFIGGRAEDFLVGSAWELWTDLKSIKLNEEWHERP